MYKYTKKNQAVIDKYFEKLELAFSNLNWALEYNQFDVKLIDKYRAEVNDLILEVYNEGRIIGEISGIEFIRKYPDGGQH